MKIFILFVLAITTMPPIVGYTQQENALGYVVYKFSHMRDTTNPTKFYHEEMILSFGKYNSLYNSLTKSTLNTYLIDTLQKSIDSSGRFKLGKINLGTPDEIFTFLKPKQLVKHRKFRQVDYVINDTLPNLHWTIEEKTRKIDSFECQKATCFFKGRHYEAWFCVDLPYQFGPWKLNGLPGLILEATDIDGQVSFKFSKLSFSVPAFAIQLPDDTVSTSEKELNKAIQAYYENPISNGSGSGIEITLISGPRKMPKPINNPIERNSF